MLGSGSTHDSGCSACLRWLKLQGCALGGVSDAESVATCAAADEARSRFRHEVLPALTGLPLVARRNEFGEGGIDLGVKQSIKFSPAVCRRATVQNAADCSASGRHRVGAELRGSP